MHTCMNKHAYMHEQACPSSHHLPPPPGPFVNCCCAASGTPCFACPPRHRTLVGEGHVDALRLYGPEQNSAIVTLKASAPGGARQCKVCDILTLHMPVCCCDTMRLLRMLVPPLLLQQTLLLLQQTLLLLQQMLLLPLTYDHAMCPFSSTLIHSQ
jgi:hypothetical protein